MQGEAPIVIIGVVLAPASAALVVYAGSVVVVVRTYAYRLAVLFVAVVNTTRRSLYERYRAQAPPRELVGSSDLNRPLAALRRKGSLRLCLAQTQQC